MLSYNNRKHSMFAKNYTFVLIGLLFIFQDVHIVPSEAYPQIGFPFDIFRPPPVVENIAKGVGDTMQHLIPKNSSTTNVTVKHSTTVIKQESPNLLNIFNPFNIFQSPKKTETITTTTAAPNPIGGIFAGIGNMLGWNPTTTTTTLYPPPRGGRGFSGVVYNFITMVMDMFDLFDNTLMINDDWEPGYMAKKMADIFESIKSEIDIFLQMDQPGGLGEIPKSFMEIWNDLNELFKIITSGDVVKMIGLPFLGGKTVGDIGKLNGQFAVNFPKTDESGRKPRPSERMRLNNEEFQKIMNHTENMIKNLLHIEEVVQNIFPNNTILHILGHFRVSFTKALEDSKATGKPIVLDTFQTLFPNDFIAKNVAVFGKILSTVFSNFAPFQMIGGILQQELIVNVGLSIVQAFTNPFFENIEKLIETFIQNMADRYLSLDPAHFTRNLIVTFEKRFGSFGTYLEKFQNLTDRAKVNFTEGDIFQQVLNITEDILTSRDTQEFFKDSVEQILKIIPFDFGENAVQGITSVITDGFTAFINFLSRGLQIVFPQSRHQTPEFMNVTTLKPNAR